ncbi:VTT domain-containing protein [Cecembia sp.]|uniref:VTT domain-containing protein n=1 Tax=Cecembia sp. TaxID=1898110 RepID=UPI0025BCE79B|nr:VTT domain-containing protein [Cecembia sp.]
MGNSIHKKPLIGEKGRFLIRNILRGFLYLGILVALFFLIRNALAEEERMEWFGTIYNNHYLVMLAFVGSEILFGIIPPEVFMLWSLETGWIGPYFPSIGMLSIISYTAGYFNFNIGRIVKNKSGLLKSRNKFVRKYMKLFEQYGAFLIIVASVSPLPFSAIALLSGAGGLERNTYLKYSLLRIVRFFVYAYILWLVQR